MRKRISAALATTAAALLVMTGCDAGGYSGEGPDIGPSAPEFPTRTIEFVSPFAPGGTTDPLSREFTRMLGEELDGSFVVNNLPGGDTTIGISTVIRSDPDGYTLGLSSTAGTMIQPLINPDLDYTADDFFVITKMVEGPNAIVVASDSPFQTLDDLLAAAEDTPGQISIATTGRFISTTFVAVALEEQADVQFNVVPYDGGGEATVAIMGGEVDAAVITVPGQLGLIQSGDLRALAYTGENEGYATHVPGAVAFIDAGFDIPFPAEYFIIGPAGLPEVVRELLETAAQQVLDSPEWNEWALSQALIPTALTGADAREWFQRTYQATENVVQLIEGRFGS